MAAFWARQCVLAETSASAGKQRQYQAEWEQTKKAEYQKVVDRLSAMHGRKLVWGKQKCSSAFCEVCLWGVGVLHAKRKLDSEPNFRFPACKSNRRWTGAVEERLAKVVREYQTRPRGEEDQGTRHDLRLRAGMPCVVCKKCGRFSQMSKVHKCTWYDNCGTQKGREAETLARACVAEGWSVEEQWSLRMGQAIRHE